ncbi:CLIP domain-containing serine protease B4-like [Ochlerotatus camptorhynchus]|uniref:CLIP domain-containing serine protease B4-like n=1 Tax=Ochlerotatus camptorhynchus TaxID=644619 RepID=UPI0031E00632
MSSDWLKLCQWFLIIGIVWTQDPDSCFNSRARDGKCVHIELCPELREIAHKRVVSKQESEFLAKNSCGKAMVCCENPLKSKNALPGVDTCGLGNVGDKIIGGDLTDLGQYRWMVAIELLEDNERKIICGGSLINTLYVLTAAHCAARFVPEILFVRLGEFDLEMDPDCDEYNNCNDPVMIVGVSQKIIHHRYGKQRNDIALLKLEKALPTEYTQFILPICLPSPELVGQQSFINEVVWAAGWGNTETGELSRYKLHVKLMVTNLDECRVLTSRSELGQMHLCARSPIEGAGDTCTGDSGGPLMINLNGNWFVIGIVSFGEPCGSSTRPAVYVNVSNFVDWILENTIE